MIVRIVKFVKLQAYAGLTLINAVDDLLRLFFIFNINNLRSRREHMGTVFGVIPIISVFRRIYESIHKLLIIRIVFAFFINHAVVPRINIVLVSQIKIIGMRRLRPICTDFFCLRLFFCFLFQRSLCCCRF